MSFLDNILPFKSANLDGMTPVHIAGVPVGWTQPHFAAEITRYGDAWRYDGKILSLSDEYTTFEDRTKAVDESLMNLSALGFLPVMPDYTDFGGTDWFPVRTTHDAQPVCVIKRFYVHYLGILHDSVMLNGFFGNQYWNGIRSMTVHDAPGQWDILSAGGVCHGTTAYETLLDEAYYEAGLSPHDLANVTQCPPLRLYYLNAKGYLKNEYFNIFDLDTKGAIIPETRLPLEVEGFRLLPITDVMKLVEEGSVYKEQINLVITDFLLRHGYIDHSHPEFEAIKRHLYAEWNAQ